MVLPKSIYSSAKLPTSFALFARFLCGKEMSAIRGTIVPEPFLPF
jgi:hypothetical protein